MWHFEDELVRLEKKYRDYRDPNTPRPVVFYGGSSIRFWGPSPYSEFRGPYLAEALGLDHAVNLGFGGALIQDCVYLFERLIVPMRPKALLIYAGDNDLANQFSSACVLNALRFLLYKTRHYFGPIPFTFIAIKPSPLHSASLKRIRQTNVMIRDALEADHHAYYADVFTSALDGQGNPRHDLFLEDRIHLSARGYGHWTEVLLALARRQPIFGD